MSRYIQYDIALSFSGEDRSYVEEVATILKSQGIRVFYDMFEEENLWGKNLYDILSDIYQNKALYTIMFISKNYAKGLWTNHERQSMQARAFKENYEYILPARFDDTIIPGLLSTIGYVELKELSPQSFSNLVLRKLKNSSKIETSEISRKLAFSEIKSNLLSQIKMNIGHPTWELANRLIDELSGIEILLLLYIDQHSLGHLGSSYTRAREYINDNVLQLIDEYDDLRSERKIFEDLDIVLAPKSYETDFIPPDAIEIQKHIQENKSSFFRKVECAAIKLSKDPKLEKKINDYSEYRTKIEQMDKIRREFHIDISIYLQSLTGKSLIKQASYDFTRNPVKKKTIQTTELGKLICSCFKL